MAKTEKPFTTLGEKFESMKPNRKPIPVAIALSLAIGLIVSFIFDDIFIGAGITTVCAIFLLAFIYRGASYEHPLIRYDQQGFIADLKISRKTAIFDGNNIYHFGLDNGIGRLPLGALVSALRSEGYRIVCFFDANIYFTLRDNGEFSDRKSQFSIKLLRHIFELQADEIYVVPSGVQADPFIIETLSHLPVSFVVTNDRFRDSKENAKFLATNKQWRKGVRLQGNRLILYQHKFKHPLDMT